MSETSGEHRGLYQTMDGAFKKDTVTLMKQAAELLQLDLRITTKPGEKYTTREGYQYPLEKDYYGVQVDFPADGKGLSDFWKTFNTLQEEAKKV